MGVLAKRGPIVMSDAAERKCNGTVNLTQTCPGDSAEGLPVFLLHTNPTLTTIHKGFLSSISVEVSAINQSFCSLKKKVIVSSLPCCFRKCKYGTKRLFFLSYQALMKVNGNSFYPTPVKQKSRNRKASWSTARPNQKTFSDRRLRSHSTRHRQKTLSLDMVTV